MNTWRREMVSMVLRFALVVSIVLLPMPAGLAGSKAAAGLEKEVEIASRGEMRKAEGAEPDVKERITLIDPETGKLIDPRDVGSGRVVELPPGEIKGAVTEADGITPHANVKVVLMSADTGKELMSATTDENGKFVLRDVPEGLYVVFLGNPGMGAVLMVTREAELGLLNIMLPEAASSRFPQWAPGWMHERPLLATVAVAAAGTTVVVGSIAYFGNGGGHGRKKVFISPIVP